MPEATLSGAGTAGTAATAATVLVVDDQATFRSVATLVVSMVPGWRLVGEAGTGEDAVDLAADLVPDVVVMDINLPGISGLDATERIVAARPATRVVLASTYASEDLPAEALLCGAVGYIRKEELTPASLADAAAGAWRGKRTT